MDSNHTSIQTDNEPNLALHLDKEREKRYRQQLANALSESLVGITPQRQKLVEHNDELETLAYVMQMSLEESFHGEEAALRASAIDAGLLPDGFPLLWYVFNEIKQYKSVDINSMRLVCKQWKRTVDSYSK